MFHEEPLAWHHNGDRRKERWRSLGELAIRMEIVLWRLLLATIHMETELLLRFGVKVVD